MLAQRPIPSREGRRIVICDYNALLLSVTGLLRMSGYCVFQAYDGHAVLELCARLPDSELVVLNTYGTGMDTGAPVRQIRETTRGMPVLHIGSSIPEGVPDDVPTIPEGFTADQLLTMVTRLMPAPADMVIDVPVVRPGASVG